MNDYPFPRIVLDIVELLQDLKAQGMAYLFCINGSGSVDVTLFASDASYKQWADADGQKLAGWYIMPDDTRMAHMCWNDLIAYKNPDDFEFDAEKQAERKEYLEER